MNSKREIYYFLLKENRISDILSEIPELSYSKKISLLKKLLNEYSPKEIDKALLKYKIQYININRGNLSYIDKILKGLCFYGNWKDTSL